MTIQAYTHGVGSCMNEHWFIFISVTIQAYTHGVGSCMNEHWFIFISVTIQAYTHGVGSCMNEHWFIFISLTIQAYTHGVGSCLNEHCDTNIYAKYFWNTDVTITTILSLEADKKITVVLYSSLYLNDMNILGDGSFIKINLLNKIMCLLLFLNDTESLRFTCLYQLIFFSASLNPDWLVRALFLILKSQFYIMNTEIYISRRWAKLPLAENIRDTCLVINWIQKYI